MSIQSLCQGDLLEILRGAPTPGAMGGVSRDYESAGSFVCLVQTANADEILKHEARGMRLTHQAYCASNPGVTEADRLRWRKQAGTTVGDNGPVLRVLGAYSEGRPGADLLRIVNLEQLTTRDET